MMELLTVLPGYHPHRPRSHHGHRPEMRLFPRGCGTADC